MWLVSYVAIVQGQGSGVNPEEQVSDLLGGIHTSTAPLVSCTDVGHTPDHTRFAEGVSKTVSVLYVDRPLTAPLVKGAEGGGLDGPVGSQHVISFGMWLL